MSYTPGPWRLELQDDTDGEPFTYGVFAGEHGSYEETLCQLWSGEHDNVANGTAICAVPLMITALEAVALDQDFGGTSKASMALVHAALDAARGE